MRYAFGFFRRLVLNWTNFSLRTKGLLAFSIPVAAILVSATLQARLDHQKADYDKRLQQVFDMRAQLQNMLIVLVSAESEVRNYALNGREDGVQPFGLTSASMDNYFSRLKELTHDDAEQRARLARMEELIHARLDGLKELREIYHASGGVIHPSDELQARARIFPDVLLKVTDLGAAEAKLLQERTKGALERQASLKNGILVSRAVGLLGGMLAVWLFTGAVARRLRRLEKNASNLAEGLPSDDPCPGADELGRLAAAIEKAGAVITARGDELKLALEGGGVLIWELDPDSGRIRYQVGGAKTSGTFPSEQLPETIDAYIGAVHVDDRARVEQELNRIVSEGGAFQIEYRVVVRGGSVRWMVVRAQSYILRSGERRLLGVKSDITAAKEATAEIERQGNQLRDSREALERQTRILQSILDSMGDGVVVADIQGKFIVFNPAARKMLGVRSFGGETDQWARQHGLFLPDMVTLYPAEQLPFTRAVNGESVDDAEIFLNPAGATEKRWVSVTARPMREEHGEIQGGVVVIRDITAAKHSAAALELSRKEAESANQAKSEFLSRMSHELRTPLNSILGFGQLLGLEPLSEQAADNVYQILKGGYHLLDLINEILDLARIESGRFTVSLEAVRMREVLKDALDLVRPQAIEKNVTITSDVALGCAHHVRADFQRLKQVFLNLLSNAIKFNRSGGSVVLSCEETQDKKLRIEVLDTGPGISAEGLRKIFRPFERLGADGADGGGTGLGLALSRRLMEAMGGTIGVESSVGFGSRFFVELALAEDPAAVLDHEDTANAASDAVATGRSRTVLYIEDNSSNLRLVERIFALRPDVRLLSAVRGSLGLDLAELHNPDWILLDLHLPDISGEEVLRRLRANPGTARIPVTILSADATPGQINRLIEAGARDYLTKPLDVRKLIHLLEKTISGSPQAEETDAYAERNYSK